MTLLDWQFFGLLALSIFFTAVWLLAGISYFFHCRTKTNQPRPMARRINQ
jgi:hypothetical protein